MTYSLTKRLGGIVFAAVALLATTAQPAEATPTVSFTVTGATFQSTGVCDVPPCRYQWRFYRTATPDRLGTTMGEGETLSFVLPAGTTSAVVLKVTNGSRAHGSATATEYVTT